MPPVIDERLTIGSFGDENYADRARKFDLVSARAGMRLRFATTIAEHLEFDSALTLTNSQSGHVNTSGEQFSGGPETIAVDRLGARK